MVDLADAHVCYMAGNDKSFLLANVNQVLSDLHDFLISSSEYVGFCKSFLLHFFRREGFVRELCFVIRPFSRFCSRADAKSFTQRVGAQLPHFAWQILRLL